MSGWCREHHDLLANFEYYERMWRLQWSTESIHWMIVCSVNRRANDCGICLRFIKDVNEIWSSYMFERRL